MACLNMLNNDQQAGLCPRISFSNDFFTTQQQPPLRHDNVYKEAPVSSDFEFSVSGHSMISAGELFCKGKLLPLRDNCTKTTTLKDELLVDDDIFPRMRKGMIKSWKELLGLKRSHILPRKADKTSGGLDRVDETKTPDFYQYHMQEELMRGFEDGGSNDIVSI